MRASNPSIRPDFPVLVAQGDLAWVPTAKKNRHRVTYYGPRCPACGKAGKIGIRASAQAEADQEALRYVAAGLRARGYQIPRERSVRLCVTYLVGPRADRDRVHFEVWDLGPEGDASSPVRRRGRARDLDNLVQGMADAFQGHLYHDDDQVAEIEIRREPNPDPVEDAMNQSRRRPEVER